jgi:hypothetical protein
MMEIVRIQNIQNRIFQIRGYRVMLDMDLAALYEVPTKALNQAVKRNIKRFPHDFLFRLNVAEWNSMRSHFVTAYDGEVVQSQIVTASQNKRNIAVTPYAFTEQGVAMLSGILGSDKAIAMNIEIMRVFVATRNVLQMQPDLSDQLSELKDRIGEHDIQLNEIYDAIENLLDERSAQKKWEERERIGFKK